MSGSGVEVVFVEAGCRHDHRQPHQAVATGFGPSCCLGGLNLDLGFGGDDAASGIDLGDSGFEVAFDGLGCIAGAVGAVDQGDALTRNRGVGGEQSDQDPFGGVRITHTRDAPASWR
jgi:hypothetical protein